MVAGVRALRARGGLGPRRRCGPRAVRDGDEWVINGTKNWITNLGVADFYVVFAVTDREGHRAASRAFVVEADRPGFSRRQARAQARDQGLADRPADLRRRPRPRREPDRRGRARASRSRSATLERTRLGAAAQAVGHRPGRDRLRRRLREGAHRVRQADHRASRAIQFKLADMETRTAAARELLYKACAMVDRGDRRTWASTRRWRSCSPPTPRWR